MVARSRILLSMLDLHARSSRQEAQSVSVAFSRTGPIADLAGLLTMAALLAAYLIARL
ncbi:hypothetical protein NET02_05670 [Thermomicrobiaceae bacterium CFH 74404]|uniref:Uncharacterized protein n=1 Tax=Thermalbibacter longus TaxID=2951981 RepID=A0AA41WBF7_9BACT|nr:hypothetical protein [Thermalbibacter longus]MCM8748627.1 hypothetical protein [Thermalbibacter longus]